MREADAAGGAVLGHLREPLALEGRLLRGVDDPRVGEEIAREEAPVAAEPQLQLGLDAADAREVEVLALAARRARPGSRAAAWSSVTLAMRSFTSFQ